MEQRPSQLLNRLSESATIAMARKATELKQSGVDVISLSLGEPDFDTPEVLKQAGIEAIEKNITHYTPVPGLQDVREAICAKFKRDNGLDFAPSQIVVSNGAKQSITNVVLTLVDPGEEVILPAPYWVSYADMVAFAGGTSKVLPTSIENDFKIQPDELEAAINDKTRLLIYSSPCNPSGSVYTREEIEALAEVLKRHPHVYIISDEIYELINFTDKHASMAAQPGMWERTVTVNGISKGFAMTGWRIGWTVSTPSLAIHLRNLISHVSYGSPGFVQAAGVTAITGQLSEPAMMKATYRARRDAFVNALGEIGQLRVLSPQAGIL